MPKSKCQMNVKAPNPKHLVFGLGISFELCHLTSGFIEMIAAFFPVPRLTGRRERALNEI